MLDYILESGSNTSDDNMIVLESLILMDEDFYSESSDSEIMTKIKNFFLKLYYDIRDFIVNLKYKFQIKMSSKLVTEKIDKLCDEMDSGKNPRFFKRADYKMVDIWELEKEFTKAVESLDKLANKFSETKYSNPGQIERDTKQFKTEIMLWNDKLDKIKSQKVNVPAYKFAMFIRKERKNPAVFKRLVESEIEFKKLQKDAENLAKRVNALGEAMIDVKHLSFIERMSLELYRFRRNWSNTIIDIMLGFNDIFGK